MDTVVVADDGNAWGTGIFVEQQPQQGDELRGTTAAQLVDPVAAGHLQCPVDGDALIAARGEDFGAMPPQRPACPYMQQPVDMGFVLGEDALRCLYRHAEQDRIIDAARQIDRTPQQKSS
nr:hypothetical protein [Nocardia terpenica]